MLFPVFFLLALITCGDGHLAQLAARLPLPGTPAAPGSPWPRPESLTENISYATISSRDLSFIGSTSNCDILNSAFARYNAQFLFRDVQLTPAPNTPALFQVWVNIPSNTEDNLCQEFPRLDIDPSRNYERYRISIIEGSDNTAVANISAWTVWGALRGLETFSQLIWMDEENESHFYVNFTEISDAPRFPHRGFMLDTARHFVDIPIIQGVLDGMSYNKLNVFHWHIVDDQSFPFVSKTFPELSQKGAYHPKLTYEPEEVQEIMEYARERGIRIILEFDTPGHTQGFGKSHPEILTPCFGEEGIPGTPNYPIHAAYEILDPTRNVTYDFMKEFFTEVKEVSKDEHVHLGMDEAYHFCWDSSPLIKEFMEENNYTSMSQVQGHYTKKHLEMVIALGLKPIIWHDPIDAGVEIPNNVIIQVWKGGNSDGTPSDAWIPYFEKSLKANFTSILSSCWYLNYISYGESWRKYYECDPIVQLPNLTEQEKSLVLGGEAAYWGEYADTTNFLPRIFPFIGPTAERLWSPEFPIHKNLTDDAMHRLDQFRCRLLWRGIPAQPIFNGYCFGQEKTSLKIKPNLNNASGKKLQNYFALSFIATLLIRYN